MMDAVSVSIVSHESDHVRRPESRAAQTRGNVGRTEIGWLRRQARAHVPLEGRIDNRGGFGDPELVAHCA